MWKEQAVDLLSDISDVLGVLRGTSEIPAEII
jgi:hypothetical protein